MYLRSESFTPEYQIPPLILIEHPVASITGALVVTTSSAQVILASESNINSQSFVICTANPYSPLGIYIK